MLCSAGVRPSSLSYLSAFLWQPASPGGAHEIESERTEGVLDPAWNFYSLVQREGIFNQLIYDLFIFKLAVQLVLFL